MSLYLQVQIGPRHYLLDAAHVVELRRDAAPASFDSTPARGRPSVDLREILEQDAAAQGHCILYAQGSGEPAALLVDRVEGLLDLDDDAFCPLPPIGPLGELIDAISTRLVAGRALLRLRGEHALRCSNGLATSGSTAAC